MRRQWDKLFSHDAMMLFLSLFGARLDACVRHHVRVDGLSKLVIIGWKERSRELSPLWTQCRPLQAEAFSARHTVSCSAPVHNACDLPVLVHDVGLVEIAVGRRFCRVVSSRRKQLLCKDRVPVYERLTGSGPSKGFHHADIELPSVLSRAHSHTASCSPRGV